MPSRLLLKLYSPIKLLLVFSLINNSGLEAGLELVHTEKEGANYLELLSKDSFTDKVGTPQVQF